MELSRKQARSHAINLFKQVRLCVQSRQLCQIVRANRPILNKKDVAVFCAHISNLCKDWGCKEQSETCLRASKVLNQGDEKGYLKLCEKSCNMCGHTPINSSESKTDIYVA